VDRALNLDVDIAARFGHLDGEGEIARAARAPAAIGQPELARLVPALDEVVTHVDGGRARQLDVHVVHLVLASVPGRHHRVRVEVEPAEEGRFRIRAGIDQPGFLVLAVARMGAVPPDRHAGAAGVQHRELLRRSPERIRLERLGFRIRTPENEPDVHASGRRTVQDVEGCSPPVRHPEARPHERHRRPDAVAGGINRLADATERRLAVDQRAQPIAWAHRVGGSARMWDVASGARHAGRGLRTTTNQVPAWSVSPPPSSAASASGSKYRL
jgi:hypothetical protein